MNTYSQVSSDSRKNRSTADAIHLVRRITEYGESTNNGLHLVLLDWEKAFDKIDQSRMFRALERLNVPEQVIKVIKTLYAEPTFVVKIKEEQSEPRRQNSGIRQGCPLSPYLFTLVMNVLFKDVKAQTNSKKMNEPIEGIKFNEVLYADDTLLIGTHTQNLNKLLQTIQNESKYYNLALNQDKCVNITINRVCIMNIFST